MLYNIHHSSVLPFHLYIQCVSNLLADTVKNENLLKFYSY